MSVVAAAIKNGATVIEQLGESLALKRQIFSQPLQRFTSGRVRENRHLGDAFEILGDQQSGLR